MKKILQMLLILILAVLLTGCSEIVRKALVSSGEYEHNDLSESQFVPDIEQKAKVILQDSESLKDFENAARLFGSIGKLDEMDEAAMEYLNKDPSQSALLLFKDCLKIRTWYEKKANENKKKGG